MKSNSEIKWNLELLFYLFH